MMYSKRSATTIVAICLAIGSNAKGDILQPLSQKAIRTNEGGIYIPSTPETVLWGSLPNRDTKPLLTVPSGAVVTFDSVSHEGILEDQGRDPIRYLGKHGVEADRVLTDAKAIAASGLPTKVFSKTRVVTRSVTWANTVSKPIGF